MRACLTTELTPEEAVEAARNAPSMAGCNIVDKIGSHPMTPEEVDALVTGKLCPLRNTTSSSLTSALNTTSCAS